MKTQKKIKRKLNIKALLLLLLIIYLIVMILYTFLSQPIKNIYIKNTNLLTDNEIIEKAGIKEYPSLFKTSSHKLEKKISSLELVESVKVSKNLLGKVTINIKEAIPLYYNRNTSKVVLSNNKEVENNSKYLGIPTLINSVPKDLLQDFTASFAKVDPDIIKMINEIEYDPYISNNIVIDNSRFLLRMNDTNLVYVNIINMKRLNDYKEFIAMIDDNRGTLLLDSYNDSNNLLGVFKYFDEKDTKDTTKDQDKDKDKSDQNED